MLAGGTNELLLKAALLRGEPALRAWEEWKRSVDLRNPLEPECYRMLPLLYGNLRALGAASPWMDKLAGVHRREWYRNRLLLHDALEYLKASLDTAVPEDALAQLKRARASELERRMQRAVRSAHALLGTLPILWYRYLLQRGAWDGPSARDFLGFPLWLKRTPAMDARRLAVWAASRACANTGRAVRAAARSALAPFR